jgi:5'-deoxynucleotidase YfbR-like HD superfamily hydrolase
MNRAKLLATSRLAGQVLRYHTWPVHRQQSVGEHTWQVMRIYYHIWGPLPSATTTAILWHDAGELATGDPPFPFKAKNPSLKSIIDSCEEEAVENMGGNPRVALSVQEKRRVKTCDLLEMVEYGLHEYHLGNAFALPIITDVTLAIHNLYGRNYSDVDYNSTLTYLVKKVDWGDLEYGNYSSE